MTDPNATEGVQFPVTGERRSSTEAGKTILSRAAASVHEGLARDIASASEWRKTYVDHLGDVVEAGIPSYGRARDIAEAGLEAVRDTMVFLRGDDELPLPSAFERYNEAAFETFELRGEGKPSVTLSIPFRGDRLEGDALLRQLDAWEAKGTIEPSCNQAVREVMANPEWLDLSDLDVVVLGAASEMGPLQTFLGWGAHVIAVDLPRPGLWERVIEVALEGAGRLSIPVRAGSKTDIGMIAEVAGADLMTEAPEVRTWIDSFEGDLALGNYVYADGGDFLRLAAVVDAMIQSLIERRGPMSLAHLATPTDVYAVPSDVVGAARSGRRAGLRGAVHSVTRTLTGRRLYLDNYRDTTFDEDGRTWGLSDCLVPQQGPNYALAKNLQRWRATVAREGGSITSANLAPATRTRSVVKNRVLAAAYAGAPRFGIEIFQSSTSAVLMSTLLVHDLRNPKALAHPEVALDHPYDLLIDGAAHGGLLRMAHEPRSILPLAVLLGFVKTS
jgi:hypothetical protein